jgi:hypothetical protein
VRSQVKLLQRDVDAQRLKADADQTEAAALRLLGKEIRAQYPQVSEVTIGIAVADAPASAPGPHVVIVQLRQSRALSKADRTRLGNWLRVRLPEGEVHLTYE